MRRFQVRLWWKMRYDARTHLQIVGNVLCMRVLIVPRRESGLPPFLPIREADIPGMAFENRTLDSVTRIALAIWCVLLPVLPAPSQEVEKAPVEPVSCCCNRDCGNVDMTPRCAREAPVPCSSGNSCARCPAASGSLVFLAPDGIGLQKFDFQELIRLEDQSPRDAYSTPPDRPPQSSFFS